MMQAIIDTGSSGLQMKKIPKPKITKGNQLLVKITKAGMNPIDCKVRSAKMPCGGCRGGGHQICRDYAGIVEEVGKDVKG
jgi:NADPH:quinone reductase-like Zn-dependent oxidoreductase